MPFLQHCFDHAVAMLVLMAIHAEPKGNEMRVVDGKLP